MMGGAPGPGDRVQRKPSRDRESPESQTISVATVNYFIQRHQNSCDGSELLHGDLQNVALLRR